MTAATFRALVCVNTCRRLWALRRYLPHYADFCERDPRFDLVVALDGFEADYLEFCERWRVPLVYSDQQEGVGISKNRVLQRYPDYDYYFFVEDDLELMDEVVFEAHVQLARASDIHHFSLFGSAPRQPSGTSSIAGYTVAHGGYGGAQFNFFTGEGLRAVGGWHKRFAEFRRWGHTEHSLRFVNRGLAKAPFNAALALNECFIWHSPPMVTRVVGALVDANEIALPERELIEQRLTHAPVHTLSPCHHNGLTFDRPSELARLLCAGERYPLITGAERRICESDYRWWKATTTNSWLLRCAYSVWAAVLWPANPTIRHAIKTRLGL